MEVSVVCTGRGSHKRHTFNELTVVGDTVTMRNYRIANMPELAGIEDEDGATLLHQAIMPPFYDPRTSKGGWRWQCPHCPTRVRFSTDELASWMREKRVADISVAPTQ